MKTFDEVMDLMLVPGDAPVQVHCDAKDELERFRPTGNDLAGNPRLIAFVDQVAHDMGFPFCPCPTCNAGRSIAVTCFIAGVRAGMTMERQDG